MSILFNDIVFGPLKSRRFGISLGINLLPLNNKVCNFNCIYCECGWTDLKQGKIIYFPLDIIEKAIEQQFSELSKNHKKIDSITFAGNGEPTMHPYFLEIMKSTVSLRNKYLPKVGITVLSNSALLGNKRVMEGLLLADKRVMKLDAGSNRLLNEINLPLSNRDIAWYISKLKSFNSDLMIQSIFLKGYHKGKYIDNTSPEELELWLNAVMEIHPKEVMIYTIDRETPAKELEKISEKTLRDICEMVIKKGIKATVYY